MDGEESRRYGRGKLRYPGDLTDPEWELVEPLILPGKRGGGKRTVAMREGVNGLMSILSTGCRWRAIPKDLPPKSTLLTTVSTFGPTTAHWRISTTRFM